jgi:hypothetical protein
MIERINNYRRERTLSNEAGEGFPITPEFQIPVDPHLEEIMQEKVIFPHNPYVVVQRRRSQTLENAQTNSVRKRLMRRVTRSGK